MATVDRRFKILHAQRHIEGVTDHRIVAALAVLSSVSACVLDSIESADAHCGRKLRRACASNANEMTIIKNLNYFNYGG